MLERGLFRLAKDVIGEVATKESLPLNGRAGFGSRCDFEPAYWPDTRLDMTELASFANAGIT